MEIYNINNVPKYIKYPDFYFTPEYGNACEYSDNTEWELCIYKDLMFCYLKNHAENKIITPYGYSGFYYENKSTFNQFIPKFREYLKSIKIKEEIIRQNPYVNNNIKLNEKYDLIKEKTIFGINVSSVDEYLKKVLNSKTRNILNKAVKIGLKCDIIKDNTKLDFLENFKKLYYKSMDNLETNDYYYFNNKYFNVIFNMKNTILCVIKNKDNNEIGYGLFFVYNNFLHYHLSCNDKSNNCTHNFMIYNVLISCGLNKTFILGCGLEDNDNLFKFKKKISNIEFKYKIYQNYL